MTCTFRDMRLKNDAFWAYTLWWEDTGDEQKVLKKERCQSTIKAQAIQDKKCWDYIGYLAIYYLLYKYYSKFYGKGNFKYQVQIKI